MNGFDRHSKLPPLSQLGQFSSPASGVSGEKSGDCSAPVFAEAMRRCSARCSSLTLCAGVGSYSGGVPPCSMMNCRTAFPVS